MDDIFSALDPATAAEIFSRLFGPDGLVKTLGSTVILATQSGSYLFHRPKTSLTPQLVQFFGSADRVILITSDGTVEVQSDDDDTAFQRQVEEYLAEDEVLAKRLQDARQEQNSSPSNSQSGPAFKEPDPVEEICEINRQQGDLSLYWFFIKTIGVVKSAIWLVLTAMLSTAEKFPGMNRKYDACRVAL